MNDAPLFRVSIDADFGASCPGVGRATTLQNLASKYRYLLYQYTYINNGEALSPEPDRELKLLSDGQKWTRGQEVRGQGIIRCRALEATIHCTTPW